MKIAFVARGNVNNGELREQTGDARTGAESLKPPLSELHSPKMPTCA